MIVYILEILAFQLVFLLTYDLFLKKETFFQWNRIYLLATFALSFVLPWIKLEVLKTTMPQELGGITIFLTQLDGVVMTPQGPESSFWTNMPWYYWILGVGSTLSALWFGYKLYQIKKLKGNGSVYRYPDFTKITVPKSTLAFSFFRNIFLGAEIQKEKETNIIAHELVHVKQHHSLDLLFFEIARIVFWFNPLVYVYQNRMAELHEFIADAQVVKNNKREHFEMLLSEAFKTQNISFVNQFFNRSLIKKRIVMLQKNRSKAVWQLKYVLLLPLVLGMLVYSSCEVKEDNSTEMGDGVSLKSENEIPFGTVDEVPVFPGCEDAVDKRACFQEKMQEHIRKHFHYPEEAQEMGIQGRVSVIFTIDTDGKITEIKKRGPHELLEKETERIIARLPQMLQPGKQDGKTVKVPFSIPITFKLQANEGEELDAEIQKFGQRGEDWVPFSSIDEAPVFPGCENAADTRACFLENIQNHIRKHFNYPLEAQEKGIQGRVAIMFAINGEGQIVDIKKKGPSPILEAEAERIIKKLPKMAPGKLQGEPAEVVFSIPITFRLK